MLTRTGYRALVAAANGGKWDCGYSTARPSSDPRTGLAAFLTDAQSGICAFCDTKCDALEMCHIVPGGYSRVGYVEGNIAMGCRVCNEIDRDSVIPYESILRPDLVIVKWPPVPVLKVMGIEAKRKAEMVKERKRQKRGL